MEELSDISLSDILGDETKITDSRVLGTGPDGRLPIDADFLSTRPSGDLFGMTEDAGMGWNPQDTADPHFLILSTKGGLRTENKETVALGLHTGHFELDLLVRQAADTLSARGSSPYAAYVTDPCDGRTQGTRGMMDSLPYRNDAAIIMRRLVRSLPLARGVMGVATCDKGLPATMMALAGSQHLPVILVPGGSTLPAPDSEDLATVQSLGARFSHGLIDLEYAAEIGCRSCGSAGGGCHFFGTAGTSQVIGEALGLALPHSALAPSGEPVWLDIAHRSALALMQMSLHNITSAELLTSQAVENAMVLHAAFGGSTNLLLHLPAISHAAGLKRPTAADWIRVNRSVPRLVDVLPNGPKNHPTAYAYMAGGVPEVMLHLRNIGLLHLEALSAANVSMDSVLDWWQGSARRQACRKHLYDRSGVTPESVIMDADTARRKGITSTTIFPIGNIAPEGSVIKATAIDPSVMDDDNIYRHRGPVKVFTSERDAIAAIKLPVDQGISAGTILVLIGAGPMGTGMEETYQLTSALKFLPHGKSIPLITDARFSGVSTGACIGHVGPEALSDGPIARLCDGDVIDIMIDRNKLEGTVNLVGHENETFTLQQSREILEGRTTHPELKPHDELPDDTRLWAALQKVSGGTWGGCVYDADRILACLEAGCSIKDTNDSGGSTT